MLQFLSMKRLACFMTVLSLFLFASCNFDYQKNTSWTLMVYLGSDNDLEEALLNNARQLRNGYAGGCNVIVFIDRSTGYSEDSKLFGENFTGCRMYRLENKKYTRLYGNESFSDEAENSANAKNLAGFISYCKENYPAEKYALFLGSHGSGCNNVETQYTYTEPSDISDSESSQTFSINAPENNISYWFIENRGFEASGDTITPSEMSSVLGKEHYVDIAAFDICHMGNYEFLYEIYADDWCPKYVTATPFEQGGPGYYYKDLVRYFDPNWHKEVDVEEFALYIVEAYRNYTINNVEYYNKKTSATYGYNSAEVQVCSLYRMDKIGPVKTAVDAFSKEAYNQWDTFYKLIWLYKEYDIFFDYQNYILNYAMKGSSAPFIDLYDMAYLVKDAGISTNFAHLANQVMKAVDELILDSFAGTYYQRFEDGLTGLSIWFPRSQSSMANDSQYYQLKSSVTNSRISGVGNWYNLLKTCLPKY